MTVGKALGEIVERLRRAGIAPSEARSEARSLLGFATGISREALFADPERLLSQSESGALEAVAVRRERREPLAYIRGEREFFGLPFKVTPAVLIPRPETEILVEFALPLIRGWNVPQVADIATGSGCIAVTIAKNVETAMVHASDISAPALDVAQQNALLNQADNVRFFQGDFLSALPPDHNYHAILSNPPYIAPEDWATLEPEVRKGEPRLALVPPDGDALHFYRRLAAGAIAHLNNPRAILAVEVGAGQAEAVAALWRAAGLKNVEIINDLAGIGRVVAGRRG